MTDKEDTLSDDEINLATNAMRSVLTIKWAKHRARHEDWIQEGLRRLAKQAPSPVIIEVRAKRLVQQVAFEWGRKERARKAQLQRNHHDAISAGTIRPTDAEHAANWLRTGGSNEDAGTYTELDELQRATYRHCDREYYLAAGRRWDKNEEWVKQLTGAAGQADFDLEERTRSALKKLRDAIESVQSLATERRQGDVLGGALAEWNSNAVAHATTQSPVLNSLKTRDLDTALDRTGLDDIKQRLAYVWPLQKEMYRAIIPAAAALADAVNTQRATICYYRRGSHAARMNTVSVRSKVRRARSRMQRGWPVSKAQGGEGATELAIIWILLRIEWPKHTILAGGSRPEDVVSSAASGWKTVVKKTTKALTPPGSPPRV